MLGIGAWIGREIEHGVVSRTAGITGLYVDSIVTPILQSLASQPRLSHIEVAALDRLLVDTPLGERIAAFKVWSPDGEILYSSDRSLIGRRFQVGAGLAGALNGDVVAGLTDLSEPENEYERARARWRRLLEVYVPVREDGGERVIAVTEFYEPSDELERQVGAARLRSWVVVAAATLAVYLLLAGMVKRTSDTIASQQRALREQVAALARLLEQNARLHERVRHAAGVTTALNEQALRRISSDLHDGPGQALGLALLRLDGLEEQCAAPCGMASGDLPVIHRAVDDALRELRAISRGLRLPELAPLTVADVAERAVRDHERLSAIRVDRQWRDLPAQVPLPIKIALFRSIQEALSNATRHGRGIGVAARIWTEPDLLCLAVSDRGPGFAPEQAEAGEGLGLVGMRERAELLGGDFCLDSEPGRGTTVRVCWPLAPTEGPWPTRSG
ncbi:MAG TPA: sensor histidine kinase [Chloroflexota bacterium]|jgi:signal transduction histidine kinase|nr:sensor histidine kinase [Chloroflexota bacterium]